MLDKLNKKILSELQIKGNLSNHALAQRLRISVPNCTERVRSLENENYITGYTAKLNAQLLGLSLLVFVKVVMERSDPDIFDQFSRRVQRMPEVIECHMVAGDFDYLIKIRVKDFSEYLYLMETSLMRLSGVKSVHTFAVLNEIRSTSHLQIK